MARVDSAWIADPTANRQCSINGKSILMSCPRGLAEPWNAAANNEARIAHRVEIFLDLLENIGADVGFKFDRVQLKKGAYQPIAHNAENEEQQQLRRAAIAVLDGTHSLKMDIAKFPVNEAATNAMKEFHERLSDAMDGKRSLSVSVQDDRKSE
jgi:hypothetical protein